MVAILILKQVSKWPRPRQLESMGNVIERLREIDRERERERERERWREINTH